MPSRTSIADFGAPLRPIVVPRPPFSLSTTTLSRIDASLVLAKGRGSRVQYHQRRPCAVNQSNQSSHFGQIGVVGNELGSQGADFVPDTARRAIRCQWIGMLTKELTRYNVHMLVLGFLDEVPVEQREEALHLCIEDLK